MLRLCTTTTSAGGSMRFADGGDLSNKLDGQIRQMVWIAPTAPSCLQHGIGMSPSTE